MNAPDAMLHQPDSPLLLPSRLAPIIERSPLPMVEAEGRQHIVRFVNAAFCTLLGKRRDELIGQPFEKIVRHEAGRCVELLDRVYETGEAATHAEPDEVTPESAFWLYAMWPALDDRNQPERVVIQLTKTARHREEAAAMNEALLIGALRQHELREAAELSNVTLQAEIAERRKVEVALQAAQDQLQANADKLERTVAERTAQLQQSVGELEAFAYSLAHDLRAPVRAIRGFTQMVLEMSPKAVEPPAAEMLQRVVTAATRMDSLIQDVLALTSVIRRPITLSPVNVEMLVRTLVEERPELAAFQNAITLEAPLLGVLGHEAILGQCLANLLSNAVKFVAAGEAPRVTVRTEAWRKDEGASAARTVRIWIEDRGIGIAPKDHERIFEIFQRLHRPDRYEGSGIGLAIVRKGVERMGGRVGLESAEGRGSRFWLELPAA